MEYNCDDCAVALDCAVVLKAACHQSLIELCKKLQADNERLRETGLELAEELKGKVAALLRFHNKKWDFEERIEQLQAENKELKKEVEKLGKALAYYDEVIRGLDEVNEWFKAENAELKSQLVLVEKQCQEK